MLNIDINKHRTSKSGIYFNQYGEPECIVEHENKMYLCIITGVTELAGEQFFVSKINPFNQEIILI